MGVNFFLSSEDWDWAWYVAEQRQLTHEGRRRAGECLGSSSRNFEADLYGVLAEYKIIQWIEFQQHPELIPYGYQFLSDRGVCAPDFWLGGVSFDVKACLPGKSFLSINAGKHRNPKKRSAFYFPAIFEDRRIHLAHPVHHFEVDRWRLMHGHSPYYSVHKRRLAPLEGLIQIFQIVHTAERYGVERAA